MTTVDASITKVQCTICDKTKKTKCTYDVSYIFKGQPKNGSIDNSISCDEQPKKLGDIIKVDLDSNGNIKSGSSLPTWAIVLIVIVVLLFLSCLAFIGARVNLF